MTSPEDAIDDIRRLAEPNANLGVPWAVMVMSFIDAIDETAEPCAAETLSWWHFRPEQTDRYWIKCTLTGTHDTHKDSNTGLTWTDE